MSVKLHAQNALAVEVGGYPLPYIEATIEPRLVWDLDTGEERTIERGCRVCGVTDLTEYAIVVSPSGVAHFQGEDGMETMRCGANGAADGWWWPC